MTLNKTKIEWCDYTWNPVSGCDHNCWYCYAKKMAQRFPKNFPNGFRPTFHEGRIMDPWMKKKPSKIFVCSIADLFAPWTPDEWRNDVLKSAWTCPTKHIFQFLTKDPIMIPKIPYPKNFWMGATVTNEHLDNFKNIEDIKRVKAGVRFVSFEPLLGALPRTLSLKGIDWVIIGKLTGSKKVKLNPQWVDDIVFRCSDIGIPIFMKNNLKPEYTGDSIIPEYPSGLIQEFPKWNVKEKSKEKW